MIKTGTFRLNSVFLSNEAEARGRKNIYRISLKSEVTAHTAYKLFKAEKLHSMDMEILSRLLLDGIGFTPDEVKELKLTDVFVPVEAEDA